MLYRLFSLSYTKSSTPHVPLAKKGGDVTLTQVKSHENVNELERLKEDSGRMRKVDGHTLRSVKSLTSGWSVTNEGHSFTSVKSLVLRSTDLKTWIDLLVQIPCTFMFLTWY
jgi:hypothetical protein